MDLVVQSPDELLAAVPHVLGFKPEESIVLVPFRLEMAALAGERARRRKDRKAALKGRPDGVSKRREKHVLSASLDLAHDLSESGGRDSEAVEHSRAEIQRLRSR